MYLHGILYILESICLDGALAVLQNVNRVVLSPASSPVSTIFSTHARKEGEPGIKNHVRDVGPYTRVYGRKCGGSLKLHMGQDNF